MASSKSSVQQIDLYQLPLPQLNQLSQQLEQEIDFFTNSLSQLKMAQSKFVESEECLGRMNRESEDREILVPLTSSMYVPGQLQDVDSVLVDVGTGYYVEMSPVKAKEYFDRKVEFITKQMEKIQPLLQEKYRTKQVVMDALQVKVQHQLGLQQQPQGASGAQS
ncbi:prefoldin subunit 5-like [Pomacea canaliculata]|uniref:prefoldin subunit 5-like n=1 Tax=Pomacea canaliculata TaxID=400727 RepID=UPI000D736D02|nr:prefoldin subunit 5-like [Pomacea canaliculata]